MTLHRFQIRDTATGETAIREYSDLSSGTSDFWWLEGNYACDCNRKMEFDRARGMSEDEIDAGSYPCNGGPNRYTFDWVEADGTRFIENDKATEHAC